MNILTAIFSGQSGFLKATKSFANRAESVTRDFTKAEAADSVVENMVGMQIDKAAAQANGRVIKVADSIMNEFIRDSIKK